MNDPFRARQRLAWIIILSGFFVCVTISVTVPLAIGRFIEAATRPLLLQLVANGGTVGLLAPQEAPRALFPGDPAPNVEPGATIVTGNIDSGLLLIYPPNQERILGRVQIYSNTNLVIDESATPRFRRSDRPARLTGNLTSGRIQVSLAPQDGRPLEMVVRTPQAEIALSPEGQFSIETTPAMTQIAVQLGRAQITANGQTLNVLADERAVVEVGRPPQGPLDTVRNLVRNPDFNQGLQDWVMLDWNVELADQPSGQTMLVNRVGEPSLAMVRDGLGHADTEVRQTIDQDVRDFNSLRLQVSMRILFHSLDVCGSRGSECPLTIRIGFEDVNGVSQAWQQGFFAHGTFSPDTPDVCVLCPPPRSPHVRVQPGQVVFFESENLLTSWRQQGIDPSRIKHISLVGAGHAFEVEVLDVSLLAEE